MPDELAQAMQRYIVDPNLAVTHGAYNYARRARFDERATIARLEEIYVGPASAECAS